MPNNYSFLATPPGEGGIHLIWVLGESPESIVSEIFRGKTNGGFKPGRNYFGSLEWRGERLDEAVVRRLLVEESPFASLAFQISVHGSMAVADSLLRACESLGARRTRFEDFLHNLPPAREFDLLRGEAWLALQSAENLRAAQFFSLQVQGALSRQIRFLIERFQSSGSGAAFRAELEKLERSAHYGLALTEPKKLVITGPTNAGKSTLFNAFLGHERAVVSPTSGTTRDAVREKLCLGSYLFSLSDTAGWNEAPGSIENLGLQVAEREVNEADFLFVVLDAHEPLSPFQRSQVEKLIGRRGCLILNKTDLGELSFPKLGWSESHHVRGSLKKATQPLLQSLTCKVLEQLSLPDPLPLHEPALFTRRQLEAVQRALQRNLKNQSCAKELETLIFS